MAFICAVLILSNSRHNLYSWRLSATLFLEFNHYNEILCLHSTEETKTRRNEATVNGAKTTINSLLNNAKLQSDI